MATVKIDLYPGTTQVTGISSVLLDRAVRRVQVTGLTNNSVIGYNEARDAVVEHLRNEVVIGDPGQNPPVPGLYHPNNTSLPCTRVVLNRWGPTTMRGYVEYSKKAVSFNNPPTNQLIERKRSFYVALRWWRDSQTFDGNGLPNGDMFGVNAALNNLEDPTAEPGSTIITVPARRILVPRVLNFDPSDSATVQNALGKINANNVQFFDEVYGIRKLRFDSCDVDWVWNLPQNTATFFCNYVFTALACGWWQQRAFYGPGITGTFPSDPSGGTINRWRTQKTLAHPEVDFGQFP